MKLEVVGVHPVDEALDPCHLIELRVLPGSGGPDEDGTLDLSGITQERVGLPGSDWQSPVEEHVLDEPGHSGTPLKDRRVVAPPARVAFFFHFLRLDRPLLTPRGPARLPPETPRPARLDFLRYPRF